MNLNKLSEMLNTFRTSFFYNRQLGSTTSLLKLLRENDNAILVVANFSQKMRITSSNEFYDLRRRVVTLEESAVMRGRSNFFFVFDNHALDLLFAKNVDKYEKVKEISKQLQELING